MCSAYCDRGDGTPVSRNEAKHRWAHVNDGHVPDIARLSTRLHAHELKVYTPFNQNVTLGVGSAPSTTESALNRAATSRM